LGTYSSSQLKSGASVHRGGAFPTLVEKIMTPGIKHLCKIMKDVSERLPLTEACGDGRKYGLDISIVLMKALRNVDACDQFWQDPIVPVTAITVYLDKLKNTMDGANVSVIAVFDGCRHPLKGITTDKRRALVDEKVDELKRLIALNDPNQYSAIRKLRKDTVHMRPDIIFVARDWCDINGVKYICAPFEADWQLAMMCKQGFIQGVISEDSDMIVLGVPKVIMGLNLADKSFILVEHDHILEQLKQFFRVDKFTHDHLLACAAFLGCDYLDNVKGNGLVEVGKVMRTWCGLLSVSEENMILTNYESTKVWNASNGGGICENYTRQFRSCTNMWKYAVGWKIVPNNNNLVPTSIDELLSPGSYSVEMDSLNERL
jgi:hypothetical protein